MVLTQLIMSCFLTCVASAQHWTYLIQCPYLFKLGKQWCLLHLHLLGILHDGFSDLVFIELISATHYEQGLQLHIYFITCAPYILHHVCTLYTSSLVHLFNCNVLYFVNSFRVLIILSI